MWTYEKALTVVQAYVDAGTDGRGVILEQSVLDRPYGWVFFYQNAAFVESGDLSYAFAGNAPIIFNRVSGQYHVTGTARPLEEYLKEYEKTLPPVLLEMKPQLRTRDSEGRPPPKRPCKSFTSTATGRLPFGILLAPNERYTTPPRAGAPVAPFDDKEKLVAWMRDAVLGDLRTLERGIQAYLVDPTAPSNRGFAGANYLLASGCFLALEYFAQVYKGGDDATANIKSFTSRFLAFNERYLSVGDITWRAFRNGLVHGGWPKVVSVEGAPSETIELMVGVRPDDPHLAPWAGRRNSFCINAVQLLRDLECVVTGEFGNWLRSSEDDVLARGAPRRLEISAGFKDGVSQFALIRSWNEARGAG